VTFASARPIAALGACALALLATGCARSTTPAKLQRNAAEVASLAQEGSLLARQAAQRRTLSHVTTFRAAEVADALDATARTLRGTTHPHALSDDVATLEKLADHGSQLLLQLSTHPDERDLARDASGQLHRLALAADRVESEWKEEPS
jgi:hypothetical protein